MPAEASTPDSAWSADPGIAGRPQLYSTRLMNEVWSLRLLSTALCLANGEITIIGSRGPKPQRPWTPPSGECDVSLPHSPEVGPVRAVFVRLSDGPNDGFVTPLYA